MRPIVLALHILITLLLIGSILLQKGEEITSSSSSGLGFNIRGKGNFLTRLTAVLGGIFFALSLTLALLTRQESRRYALGPNAPEKESPLLRESKQPLKEAAPSAASGPRGDESRDGPIKNNET